MEQPKTPTVLTKETQTRVVVCAANRYGSKIFLGARHFDERMREEMQWYDIRNLRGVFGEEQGFIDQWGIFMDRYEALAVAQAAGQIGRYQPKTQPEDRLFSEDLY